VVAVLPAAEAAGGQLQLVARVAGRAGFQPARLAPARR